MGVGFGGFQTGAHGFGTPCSVPVGLVVLKPGREDSAFKKPGCQDSCQKVPAARDSRPGGKGLAAFFQVC